PTIQRKPDRDVDGADQSQKAPPPSHLARPDQGTRPRLPFQAHQPLQTKFWMTSICIICVINCWSSRQKSASGRCHNCHNWKGSRMSDHVSVAVRELEAAARFYEATLAALGLSRLVTRPATIGFGKAYPEFWINLRAGMAPVEQGSGVHIALRAKSTGEVDA